MTCSTYEICETCEQRIIDEVHIVDGFVQCDACYWEDEEMIELEEKENNS